MYQLERRFIRVAGSASSSRLVMKLNSHDLLFCWRKRYTYIRSEISVIRFVLETKGSTAV